MPVVCQPNAHRLRHRERERETVLRCLERPSPLRETVREGCPITFGTGKGPTSQRCPLTVWMMASRWCVLRGSVSSPLTVTTIIASQSPLPVHARPCSWCAGRSWACGTPDYPQRSAGMETYIRHQVTQDYRKTLPVHARPCSWCAGRSWACGTPDYPQRSAGVGRRCPWPSSPRGPRSRSPRS
jgi:hypothetical protein